MVQIRARHFRERAAAARPGATRNDTDHEEPPSREILAGGGRLVGSGEPMSQSTKRRDAFLAELDLDCVVWWCAN